jgi:hypothetical protein
LVIGLALETWGHIRVTDITGRENRRLTAQLDSTTRDASQANERLSTNELAAKQLEIQLTETKTQLANAEARLNQSVIDLQNASLPISIGDQLGLGAALKQLPEMHVELRNVMDLKAQTTADSLLFVFGLAGWPIINRAVIGDIGSDGIVIGYNNGDESSKNAAYSLLKLLTDRNVPSEVIDDPYGDRVRGVPTNAIIVAVCNRPSKPKADLMLLKVKKMDLRNQSSKIGQKLSELMSKKYVPGSKELADAQVEYNSLFSQMSEQIPKQESALFEQERKLYGEIYQDDVGTNSSSTFSGSGTFGNMTFSNSGSIMMRDNRSVVPLQ